MVFFAANRSCSGPDEPSRTNRKAAFQVVSGVTLAVSLVALAALSAYCYFQGLSLYFLIAPGSITLLSLLDIALLSCSTRQNAEDPNTITNKAAPPIGRYSSKSIQQVPPALPKFSLDMDPLRIFPKDVIRLIISHFSPEELGRNCRVSKSWCRLASDPALWNAFDLRALFPKVSVFDESDWTAHVDLGTFGLSVTDAPPSDKRKEIPMLKKLLPSLSIAEDAGVTVLTIPKGLTINKLVKLAGSPKKGNVTKIDDIRDDLLDEIGDVAVDKTYRIVITNSVLQRSLSVNDQKKLMHKIGCELPKGLEAITLLVVTYMTAGKFLCPSETFTCCSDEIDDSKLLVGRSWDETLWVGTRKYNDDDGHYFDGVACVLRES